MRWASSLPRLGRYLAWWLAAVVVATFVAWQGVSVVADQVTDARPAPLTPEEARQARTEPGSQPPETGPEAPVPTTDSTHPPGGSARQPVEAGPETTSTGSSTSSTSSTATTSTTTEPTTTTATGAAQQVETRTYRLDGGSAVLRFSPSGVSVVQAEPNPGFRATTDETRDNGVAVTFESSSHRSVVEGWWDGDPRDRVSEEDVEGSGGP